MSDRDPDLGPWIETEADELRTPMPNGTPQTSPRPAAPAAAAGVSPKSRKTVPEEKKKPVDTGARHIDETIRTGWAKNLGAAGCTKLPLTVAIGHLWKTVRMYLFLIDL